MAQGKRGLAQAGAVVVGLAGDLGCLVVADVGIEGGDQHQGLLQQPGDAFAVRFQAHGAVVVEAGHAVGQQARALHEGMGDQRAEDVQFEIPRSATEVDGHVIAEDLAAGHGQGLALGRVDLARHDGRARFVLGDAQLADAAARAAGQPAHVIGDLHEAGGQALERAVGVDQGIGRGHDLELVGGADERQPGQPGDLGGGQAGEAGRRVQPGAYRSAAQCQLAQVRHGGAQVAVGLGQLGHPARNLLPQGQGGGVLQVGTADLDDVGEGVGLGGQRGLQARQLRAHPPLDRLGRGDVHGRGVDVVGRLAAVDVVIGVDPPPAPARAAQKLAGAVGQHLVDVHVGLGARAGLPDHQGKFAVVPPCQHFVGSGHDRLCLGGVQQPQVRIDRGRRPLDAHQRGNQLARLPLARDVKVRQRALGLRPPEAMGRHLDGAEGVVLGSGCHGSSPRSRRTVHCVRGGPQASAVETNI